jgi:head-tail adaptor
VTTFDPSADFASVTDGLEAVTLNRRGSSSDVSVTKALRRPVGVREAARSDGRYTTDDVRWHLPQSEVATTPRLGDAIIDSTAARWTITEVAAATLNARWACTCKNLALVYGLDTVAIVEAATYTKDDSGAAIAAWTTYRVIRAKFQEDTVAVGTEFSAERVRGRYRVYLEEDFEFTQDHRLKDKEGYIYRIVEWSAREAIDALQEVVCERLPWEQAV